MKRDARHLLLALLGTSLFGLVGYGVCFWLRRLIYKTPETALVLILVLTILNISQFLTHHSLSVSPKGRITK